MIVVHLVYRDLLARHDLLVRELPRLAPAAWWFIDLSLSLAGAPRGGLEVAASAGLLEWVDRSGPEVVAAAPVDGARALHPSLFPDAPPPWYVDALAVGSARASAIAAALGPAPTIAATDAAARRELLAGYATLYPGPADRRDALALHGEWLARVTGHAPVAPAPPTDDVGPIAELSEYRGLRDALAERPPTHAVARLLHIQTLRIFGPAQADPIGRELALVGELSEMFAD